MQSFDEYINLGGKETVFLQGSVTGSYAEMEKGGLLLYVQGINAAATFSTGLFFNWRVYYTDA